MGVDSNGVASSILPQARSPALRYWSEWIVVTRWYIPVCRSIAKMELGNPMHFPAKGILHCQDGTWQPNAPPLPGKKKAGYRKPRLPGACELGFEEELTPPYPSFGRRILYWANIRSRIQLAGICGSLVFREGSHTKKTHYHGHICLRSQTVFGIRQIRCITHNWHLAALSRMDRRMAAFTSDKSH